MKGHQLLRGGCAAGITVTDLFLTWVMAAGALPGSTVVSLALPQLGVGWLNPTAATPDAGRAVYLPLPVCPSSVTL